MGENWGDPAYQNKLSSDIFANILYHSRKTFALMVFRMVPESPKTNDVLIVFSLSRKSDPLSGAFPLIIPQSWNYASKHGKNAENSADDWLCTDWPNWTENIERTLSDREREREKNPKKVTSFVLHSLNRANSIAMPFNVHKSNT